jgi:hypothetical protein
MHGQRNIKKIQDPYSAHAHRGVTQIMIRVLTRCNLMCFLKLSPKPNLVFVTTDEALTPVMSKNTLQDVKSRRRLLNMKVFLQLALRG